MFRFIMASLTTTWTALPTYLTEKVFGPLGDMYVLFARAISTAFRDHIQVRLFCCLFHGTYID